MTLQLTLSLDIKKWKEIRMLIRIQLEKTDNTYYYCNSVERDEIIEHVARALIQPVATNDRFS